MNFKKPNIITLMEIHPCAHQTMREPSVIIVLREGDALRV